MKNKNIEFVSNFITPIDHNSSRLLYNHYISIDRNGVIKELRPAQNNEQHLYKNLYITPANVDLHIHLPQLPIIGMHGYELQDWLKIYTFKYEEKFRSTKYARVIAREFFSKLKRNGTGTALIYGTIHTEATDIIFQEARKAGVRAYIGKVNMNREAPQSLLQDTEKNIYDTEQLINKWNNKKNLHYAITPRFAISCTEDLLQVLGNLGKKYNLHLQTHLNENLDEIKYTKELFPNHSTYTEIYKDSNLLGDKTFLAHCIHNTNDEYEILKSSKSNIVHCPDSNFFLKSGRFPIEEFRDKGIDFGLGSDIGAGTSFDMFKIIKMMIYMQSIDNKYHPTVEEGFYSATLGAYKLLGLDKELGSIEVGKKAEFCISRSSGVVKTAKTFLQEKVFAEKHKTMSTTTAL